MMGDLPESVASGSNTFSPKIGTSGAYESDTLWSAGIATDFSTGIGRNLSDNGIYYAEIDTRRPRAVLPPLTRTFNLSHLNIETEDDNQLSQRFHFCEADQRTFMAAGHSLYEWREETTSFIYRMYLDINATSIAYFDGYLHIAGWRDDPGERDYLWIRLDNFSFGFDTSIGLTTPLLFHVFGGILYAAQGNSLYYTAGGGTETGYPDPPWQWEWVGPFQVATYGDDITGIAGIIYQQLGQRYVYTSTRAGLSVLLPGDLPFGVTQWPMSDPRNGVGMRSFYNRIYIPIGGDLFTLQSNGDLIASGVDNSIEGLPEAISGDHVSICASANLPFVVLQGYTPTVWAGKASSWHYVGQLPAGSAVAGCFFSNIHGRLWVASRDGLIAHWYMGNTNRPPRYDSNYRYQRLGILDTGRYVGALFEQPKYWHSAFVDVNCLDADTSVELVYLADEGSCYNARDDYEDWPSLGFVTEGNQELTFGYQLSAKSIRVAAILRTADPRKSPEIQAIGLRYTPKIVDRNRWSITVKLPKNDQVDATGAWIEDYDQATIDAHLGTLRKRETPVQFRDLDGQWYWVLVTGASRRIHGVGYDNDEMTYDVDWSFALTEVASL